MGKCERRDNLEYINERRLEIFSGLPLPAADHQDGGQQQGQQKQDVIKTDPDMPDTMPDVIDELPDLSRFDQLQLLRCIIWTENRR